MAGSSPTVVAAVLLASAALTAAAAEPIALDPRALRVDLTPAMEVYRDPTAKLGPAAVQELRFEPHPGRAGFGFPAGALWLRVVLENPSDEAKTWFLTFDDPLLERIDVWLAMPGGVMHRRGGYALPPAARTVEMHGPWHELPLVLLPNERIELLARLESPGPIFALARVTEGAALGHDFTRRIVQQGIHLGILIALAVLNLYSYFALRERRYLAFLALATAYMGFELFQTGLAAAFLLREAPGVVAAAPAFFAALAIHFALAFADAFLGVRSGRLARGAGAFALLAAVVALVDPRWGNRAAAAAGAFALPLLLLRAIEAARGGSRAGWFYAVAMAPLLPAALVYGLTAAGVLPETLPGRHLVHLAFSVTAFVVAFALADRVRTSDVAARASLGRAVAARTAELATTVEALRREAEERRRAEEARCESEEKLRHAQRIEAVGRLAGGIAHDYNNLLTSVTTNLSVLRMEPEPAPGERRQILDDVAEAADRGAALTRQLLAFSRRQVLSPQPIAVNRIAEGFRRLLDRLLGEGYTLRLALADGLPAVVADPSQLEQVLMNLVLNARDAMPGGGTISVGTAEVEVFAREDLPPGAAPGRYVRISVADTGAGIEPEALRHIFEPFFTTKPEGKGTGLGLATVHGIVSQHHGFVEVDPGPGRGAVFHVHFPVAPFDAIAEPVRREPGAALLTGDETVLLVEDDPVVREGTRRLLERLGYRVRTAHDAAEALRLCEQDGPLDLVISDLVMPGMDGLALIERVRARCPGVAVLLTSGHAHDVLQAHGTAGMSLPFLAKPYSAEELAKRIRAALGGVPRGDGAAVKVA